MLAREARHAPTLAEKELWERLRDSVGPFRLDFYCRGIKLAVEVDGSIHAVEAVQRRDADRQQILEQEFGICFLRVSNADVLQDIEKVITQICTLAARLSVTQLRGTQ